MIEINLLNPSGIHTKDKSQFNDIDTSFISNASDSLDVDFEKNHKVKKVNIKKNKKGIFVLFILTLLIVGSSLYYQFYINNKIIVKSENIKSLLKYSESSSYLKLVEFNADNYSISFSFKIDSKFYNDPLKKDLKEYLNIISPSKRYNIEVFKNKDETILNIIYPPFIEVDNLNFE